MPSTAKDPVKALREISDNTAAIAAQTPASLGQKTMAASSPVVLASDQSAVPVTLGADTDIIGGTRDAGPSWTSVYGVAGVPYTSADATANPAVTSAPTAGQKLVITDLIISVGSVALTLTFSEETSGTVFFKVFCPANTTMQITPRAKVKLATADKKLMMDASATGDVFAGVTYYSEA